MKKIYSLSVFLLLALTALTQERKITVQVLDSESKKPVKNATVIILGTTIRTVANVIGFFELTLSYPQDTLVVSSIGYKTTQLKVPTANQFRITLEKDYLRLPQLDITSINLLDSIKENLEVPQSSETNAEYTDGWKIFYLNFAKHLLLDSIASKKELEFEINFTIKSTGEIGNLNCSPSEMTTLVESAFAKLNKFLPAEQNNLKVDQYFVLPIKTGEQKQRFFVVEETAEPIGGIPAFYNFINKNLRYPKLARKMGVEGKVIMEFIVNRDGGLSDIKVVNGIGAGCDEESIRLIKLSPPWKPGMQKGMPVRQKMVIPIIFNLG
jgi:TonB family protein